MLAFAEWRGCFQLRRSTFMRLVQIQQDLILPFKEGKKKILHGLELMFLFFKRPFLQRSFRFTAELRGRDRDFHVSFPPPTRALFPRSGPLAPGGLFVTSRESAGTHPHPAEPAAHPGARRRCGHSALWAGGHSRTRCHRQRSGWCSCAALAKRSGWPGLEGQLL